MKELEFVKVYDISDLLNRQNFTSHGRRSSDVIFPQERFKTSLGLRTDNSNSCPRQNTRTCNRPTAQRAVVRFETSLKSGIVDGRPKSDVIDTERDRSLSIKSDSVLLKRSNSVKNVHTLGKRRGSVKSTSYLGKRRGSTFVYSYSKQDSGVFVDVKEVMCTMHELGPKTF